MASSADQNEESRTPSPLEIKFGDFDPVPLKNLVNQTPPSPLQSGISPLSPLLRHSLCRKQPRSRVSPPPSRSFPQLSPSPETLASIENGSYCKVPSKWCPQNKVWSRDLYLSRTSLLKKMIHQRILYRRVVQISNVNDKLGLEKLSSPADFWVTIPIQPPIRLQNEDPPELLDVCLDKNKGISIAYATLPEKPSRYGLNRLVGYGREPDNDGVPFLWVTNKTGTKFLDRGTIISLDIKHIVGFVECPNCRRILCIGHLVPSRFDKVDIRLHPIRIMISTNGDDEPLRQSSMICHCEGICRPVISDDLNKINWMFLFLGFGIGYCTIDQLRYYCIQRKLTISDYKTELLVTVFDDLCLQIFKRQVQLD